MQLLKWAAICIGIGGERPVALSHSRTTQSRPPETTTGPQKATQVTTPSCPSRTRTACPGVCWGVVVCGTTGWNS